MPTSTARWWPRLSGCKHGSPHWRIPVVKADVSMAFCTTGAHRHSLQGGITEEFLNNDTVTPHPVELAMAMIYADNSEACSLMQDQARRVFREDAGYELPEPQVCVDVAEMFEGDTPCPCAACTPLDIHGMLCNARITGTAPVQTCTGPGHHLAITLNDYRRIVFPLVGELGGDLRRCTWLGFKGGVALLNALVVDGGNGGGV